MPLSTPTTFLRLALLMAMACLTLAVFLVTRVPYLGLALAATAESGRIEVLNPDSFGLPANAQGYFLHSIGTAEFPLMKVETTDLVEDVDLLADNQAIARFFARQDELVQRLGNAPITVEFTTAEGQVYVREVPAGRRPLSSLPYTFWLQLVVAGASFLVGAWINSLRHQDWAARLFLLSGLGILLAAATAAVYSSRELALSGTDFRWLSSLNFLGASLFGAAITGLFLLYPRRLLPLPAVMGITSLCLTAAFYHLGERWGVLPVLGQEFYLPTTLIPVEMLAIILAIAGQYFATRGDPASRAVLRWLAMSVLTCSGVFMMLFYVPIIAGVSPPVSQAHSFVMFLLIYLGIGLGLRRYRLFDLGVWSFRIMFYLSALTGFFLLDALIISQLDFSAAVSTGFSLVVIGFGYLPLRDWLWRVTLGRPQKTEHDWFAKVMAIPFTTSRMQANQRWQELLKLVFNPLQMEESQAQELALLEEGLGLCFPGTSSVNGIQLKFCNHGKRLFSSEDLAFAGQLHRLLANAEQSKASYEEGRLQERKRIAQDLHDDIGSQLLSSLHSNDLGNTQSSIRKTISDLRAVVAGLVGTQTPLSELVSTLRYECSTRLEEASVELEWPVTSLDDTTVMVDYRFAKNITSILRECISNILRHAGATYVEIHAELQNDMFWLRVQDNGQGFQPGRRHGNGLGNIRARAAALAGSASISNQGPPLSFAVRSIAG